MEKEHVGVCLKIQIGSNRHGFLLLDPGYHVSRPVTVMQDLLYPHTGRFTQSMDNGNSKEYDYTMVTDEYVNWHVAETKRGNTATYDNLIFVAKPFLSGLDVAERRNLVYDFKSLLKRDPKGQLIAGMYFPLTKDAKMTIFYLENNNRATWRVNVSRNVRETREIQTCEKELGLNRGQLTQIMNAIGRIMHDEDFMDQTLRINEEIVKISAEN